MRFEVLMAVTMNIIIFCDVTLYSLIFTNISGDPAASIFRVEAYHCLD
jgi:hypothetical protein